MKLKLALARSFVAFALILASLTSGYSQEKKVNLALNAEVLASSEAPGYPAKNIADGKITRESKWMSATNKAPHVVELDFEKYCNVSEIRFSSGIPDHERTVTERNQATGFFSVKNFKIQYWDDANWTDFPKAVVLENRQTTVVFKFTNPISTYKIRMVADDGEKISVMEIEVIGSVSEDMPLPPKVESDIEEKAEIAGDQDATLKVTNKVVGKTFKYVGYNQGYFLPGYNVSGWLEYSGVNSIRIWPNLNTYAPVSAVQVDEGVTTVAEFDKRKADLRTNPESSKYIKWDSLMPIYATPDFSSNNTMEFDYAITESKRLGIEPVLQINSRDFDSTWSNKWQQWQRFYSLAYHAAKKADVTMFAMQNEPNHRHSGPMKLDQWIGGMQIVSDAVHSAIEDVNTNYGKNLKAKFVGPVTAGQNTDWWATIAKNIRTDYHGKTVDHDLIDIFSTHSYNSPAAGYSTRVNNIRKLLKENHPENQAIPIVFTEIGRWMNAYLIDKEETMDSPSLFTEWAGIYASNMNNGAYGMWAFKFVTNVSDAYPRGIKSGHHYTWPGTRFVEDAHVNLAKGAKVKSSSGASKAKRITDGSKSDASAWTSDATDKQTWLEIDLGKPTELGSAIIYTGSEGGVFTAPDRVRNFRLEYWTGSQWQEIPGTSQKDNKYAQVYLPFKEPVTTSKVRFSSEDEGALKVREIKLLDKDAVPDKSPDYNISGIQRTGEVVRLFAKGFKDERDLLEVNRSNDDNGLDTYVSLDKNTNTYYMWLVQRGSFAYHLDMDLSELDLETGTPIIGETVDEHTHGEVSTIRQLAADKKIKLTLPPQSVTLLSIPQGNLTKTLVSANADAYVTGGTGRTKNHSGGKDLRVSLNAANPDQNAVSYVGFKIPQDQSKIKKVLLTVSGKVDKGDKPFRLHVYAVPSEKISKKVIDWNNAPYLDEHEALIEDVGGAVKVAGELAFSTIEKARHLDVTDIVKKNATEDITFILVRETRQLGDDEDKGRTLVIKSREAGDAPRLEIWSNK
ncbi:discoidin domain-containing protein [Persicitalea jodogahamensis]|uniref:F5/8 type C domain-containing protein n=1 Tax=Persicitalea jodogahamensis TaxID=402147 RepID=A0A8J3DDD8_9BACT|nr:discoidin domain-containing protein [Persicitalea jodogahamensis]GHB86701.1 hypothetical protein GCM10007390_47960 [Persicitalea jodogahamensis]